ncbi:MAG: TatD family hydrolase, partial [Candidatus Margulisiibacteriota bacterium]
MILVDTHLHLTDSRYHKDLLPQVLKEAREVGVDWVISLSTDLQDCLRNCEISTQFDNVFCGIGIHPHEAVSFEKSQMKTVRHLMEVYRQCVVLGEIGLDYHYRHSTRDEQIQAFSSFLELSIETGWPVAIHSREAEAEVCALLKSYPGVQGVCHSYTGGLEDLQTMLACGLYISVNGMVTFSKNENILEIVKQIPLERLLLETDAPYLTPHPHR